MTLAPAAMDKYRGAHEGETGAALVVVGLSADRVAHRVGASIRQPAEVSGLGRKSVTAIVSSDARWWE
jgi:hypothetical protein